MCLFLLFVFFACIFVSKFCSISPCLSAVCTCPRYSVYVFYVDLTVFPGRMGTIKILCAWLLCFTCSFFAFVDCFSCQFCLRLFLVLLMCCLRHPWGWTSCCFFLLLVLRLGFGVLMSLLCVLCVCVHVLYRFTCVCRVQIFSFSLVLLRVCVCFVTPPIPLSVPLHLHTHPLLFMQLPDDLILLFACPICLLTWSTPTLQNGQIR